MSDKTRKMELVVSLPPSPWQGKYFAWACLLSVPFLGPREAKGKTGAILENPLLCWVRA